MSQSTIYFDRQPNLWPETHGAQLMVPPPDLCTDNGAMIAGLAYHLDSTPVDEIASIDVKANGELGIRQVRYKSASKYR